MNKEKIDDMDYYEKYLLNATKEERDCYIKEHPDFMNEYPVSYEHRELLQDKIYRGLMRKIRDYEKSREQEKTDRSQQKQNEILNGQKMFRVVCQFVLNKQRC